MRRYPKILILLVSFFIFYIPLFFALFQCYCLSEADFLGSAEFEAPDLLSQPSCSLSESKSFLLSADHDSLFISKDDFLNLLRGTSLRIPSPYLMTHVFRC